MSEVLPLRHIDGIFLVCLWQRYGVKAFFTGADYRMGFGPGERVLPDSDRRKALKRMGVAGSQLVCPLQVHGRHVYRVTRKDAGRGSRGRFDAIHAADALVTGERGVALGIQTADCLSALIFDPRHNAAAAVHAGWRGLRQGILEETVNVMGRHFKSVAQDLEVVLGPSIRSCCYEVGPEFQRYFQSGLIRREGRLFLDIPGVACSRLTGKGVQSHRIYETRLCTCCSSHFFSYRRQAEQADRSMSVIMME